MHHLNKYPFFLLKYLNDLLDKLTFKFVLEMIIKTNFKQKEVLFIHDIFLLIISNYGIDIRISDYRNCNINKEKKNIFIKLIQNQKTIKNKTFLFELFVKNFGIYQCRKITIVALDTN